MNQDLAFAIPFSSQEALFCGLKVKFHRNLMGYLFPGKIKPEDKNKLSSFILSTFKPQNEPSFSFPAPLSQDVQETFLDLPQDISHLLIDPKKGTSISIFDEDHFVSTWHTHIQDFKSLHEKITQIPHELDTLFEYAHDQKKGFLTALPEFSGLGLKLEAYLFLPTLENVPELDNRLTLSPLFQNSKMFVLKTKKTLNLELSSLLQVFLDTASKLIDLEKTSQNLLLKTSKDTLIDQVAKALALLKGSFKLSFQEALEHLLKLKLGYHLGFIDGLKNDTCLKLLQDASKAHLKEQFHQDHTDDDWAHMRSDWLKKELDAVNLKI